MFESLSDQNETRATIYYRCDGKGNELISNNLDLEMQEIHSEWRKQRIDGLFQANE